MARPSALDPPRFFDDPALSAWSVSGAPSKTQAPEWSPAKAAPKEAFGREKPLAHSLASDATAPLPQHDSDPIAIELVRGADGLGDDSWVIVMDGLRCQLRRPEGRDSGPYRCTVPPGVALRPLTVDTVVRPVSIGVRLEAEALKPLQVDVSTYQVLVTDERKEIYQKPGSEEVVPMPGVPAVQLEPYRVGDCTAQAVSLPYPFWAPAQSALGILSFHPFKRYMERQDAAYAWNLVASVVNGSREVSYQARKAAWTSLSAKEKAVTESKSTLSSITTLQGKEFEEDWKNFNNKERDDWWDDLKNFKPGEPSYISTKTLSAAPAAGSNETIVIGGARKSAARELTTLFSQLRDVCERNAPEETSSVDLGDDRLRKHMADIRIDLATDADSAKARELFDALLSSEPYPATKTCLDLQIHPNNRLGDNNEVGSWDDGVFTLDDKKMLTSSFRREFIVQKCDVKTGRLLDRAIEKEDDGEAAGAVGGGGEGGGGYLGGDEEGFDVEVYEGAYDVIRNPAKRFEELSDGARNALQQKHQDQMEKEKARQQNYKADYMFTYNRLFLDSRRRTTMRTRILVRVVNYDGTTFEVEFEAKEDDGIVAHAVYAELVNDVLEFDAVAQQLVECIFRAHVPPGETLVAAARTAADNLYWDSLETLSNTVFGRYRRKQPDRQAGSFVTPQQMGKKLVYDWFNSLGNAKAKKTKPIPFRMDPCQFEERVAELRLMVREILPVWPPIGARNTSSSDVRGLPASGLKWRYVGKEKPDVGFELPPELSAKFVKALKLPDDGKGNFEAYTFTEDEWEALGINDLRTTTFVKVGNGYFKPNDVNSKYRSEREAATQRQLDRQRLYREKLEEEAKAAEAAAAPSTAAPDAAAPDAAAPSTAPPDAAAPGVPQQKGFYERLKNIAADMRLRYFDRDTRNTEEDKEERKRAQEKALQDQIDLSNEERRLQLVAKPQALFHTGLVDQVLRRELPHIVNPGSVLVFRFITPPNSQPGDEIVPTEVERLRFGMVPEKWYNRAVDAAPLLLSFATATAFQYALFNISAGIAQEWKNNWWYEKFQTYSNLGAKVLNLYFADRVGAGPNPLNPNAFSATDVQLVSEIYGEVTQLMSKSDYELMRKIATHAALLPFSSNVALIVNGFAKRREYAMDPKMLEKHKRIERASPVEAAQDAATQAIALHMRSKASNKETVVYNAASGQRFRFYEYYLATSQTNALLNRLPSVHTLGAWETVPDSNALRLLPPADVTEAVFEAEELRGLPLRLATAFATGVPPGTSPVSPAEVAAATAARELLHIIIRSRRKIRGANLMQTASASALELVDSASRLLSIVYGSKSRGATFVAGDDLVWTCCRGGAVARLAIRHLALFQDAEAVRLQAQWDEGLVAPSAVQFWKLPRRKIVDAFTSSMGREMRALVRDYDEFGPQSGLESLAAEAARTFARVNTLMHHKERLDSASYDTAMRIVATSAAHVLFVNSRNDSEAAVNSVVAFVLREQTNANIFAYQKDLKPPEPSRADASVVQATWASRILAAQTSRWLPVGKGVDSITTALSEIELTQDELASREHDAVYYCPMGSKLDALPDRTPFAIDSLSTRIVWLPALRSAAQHLAQCTRPKRSGRDAWAGTLLEGRPLLGGLDQGGTLPTGMARHPLAMGVRNGVIGVPLSVAQRLPAADALAEKPPKLFALTDAMALLDSDPEDNRLVAVHVQRMRSVAFNCERLYFAIALAQSREVDAQSGGDALHVDLHSEDDALALAIALALFETYRGNTVGSVTAYVDDSDAAAAKLQAVARQLESTIDEGCVACKLAELALVL